LYFNRYVNFISFLNVAKCFISLKYFERELHIRGPRACIAAALYPVRAKGRAYNIVHRIPILFNGFKKFRKFIGQQINY